MSLDRDAARALFDNAPSTPASAAPIAGGAATFGDEIPLTAADASVYERTTHSHARRKGVDWRFVAPVAVAAVCAGAVFLIARRDEATPGRTVARAELTQPAVLPPEPASAPVEVAAAPEVAATAAAPAVRTTVRATPAAPRRAAPRATTASAPSATDATADASTREPYVPSPSPYVPPSSIVTPAPGPVTPQPAPTVVSPTPPIVTPEPDPIPDPSTPPEPQL